MISGVAAAEQACTATHCQAVRVGVQLKPNRACQDEVLAVQVLRDSGTGCEIRRNSPFRGTDIVIAEYAVITECLNVNRQVVCWASTRPGCRSCRSASSKLTVGIRGHWHLVARLRIPYRTGPEAATRVLEIAEISYGSRPKINVPLENGRNRLRTLNVFTFVAGRSAGDCRAGSHPCRLEQQFRFVVELVRMPEYGHRQRS